MFLFCVQYICRYTVRVKWTHIQVLLYLSQSWVWWLRRSDQQTLFEAQLLQKRRMLFIAYGPWLIAICCFTEYFVFIVLTIATI